MNPTYEDPFDNNASKAQLSTDKTFSYIYLVRCLMPSNQVFYFIFFFLKFNVAYLATNNIKGLENNIFSLDTILKALTIFGNGFCMFKEWYSIICFIIFVLIIALFLALFITYKQFIRSGTGRAVITVLAYILMLYAFLSHYVSELVMPGILSYTFTVSSSVNDSKEVDSMCIQDFKKKILDNFFLPRYVLMTMNVLSLILINSILYIFLIFMNAPTRSFKHGNLNFNYNKVQISSFVTYALQGVITTSKLYDRGTENLMRLIICCVSVLLFMYTWCSLQKTFNYYVLNFPLKYTIFAAMLSIFGGVIEIGLYFVYPFDELPTIYYLLKVVVMFLNSFLISFYFFSSLDIYFVNQLIAKIFLEKSKMTPGELATYDLLLYNYLNDKCDFSELYHIYHTHKIKCVAPKCPCRILEIDKWINKNNIVEDNEHYLIVLLTKKREEFKNSSILDFIEIAEYEIRKNILLCKKNKGSSHFQQDLLILLHLDIIYLLKKDNCIAMYFCDRYRAQAKKINYVTKYYLYEYKILISKELASIDQISSIDRVLNEKREMTRQMKEFYHYAEFMEKVKKMIVNCVFALETILRYKRNQITKGTNVQTMFSCDEFLKLSKSIQQTNRKLTKSLRDYLKTKEPDNPELCILVCYYYLMLNQKPPKKMVRKLDEILRKNKGNHSNLKAHANLTGIGEELDAETEDDYISQLAYDNVNISNPMIVILNCDDNFVIIHITMKMCSILKESKREILNNDLHNYLPKDIVKMHKIIMKEFLLNSSTQFIKDTFIMDKFSNLIPMKIICNPLNTLETNFGLVINFVEIETNSNVFFDYYFLLNSEFHFLGLNELFTQEYFFNLQMMKIIHLDFCTFFGIKAEKLNLKLRNFFANNKLLNRTEYLEEINKELSVFTCNKMENLFTKSSSNVLGKKLQPLKVKERLKKRDVINNIIQLQNNINNFGLDIEWYSRLNYFQNRLMLGIHNDTNNDNDLAKDRSFLNYFEVYYTINSIGNFYYIIVNLKEMLNNSKENQASWKKQELAPNVTITKNKFIPSMTAMDNKKYYLDHGKLGNESMDASMFELISNTSKGTLLGNNSKKLFSNNKMQSTNMKYKNKFFDKNANRTTPEVANSRDVIEGKNESERKKKTKDKKGKGGHGKGKHKEGEKQKIGGGEQDEENLVAETRTLFSNKRAYAIMNTAWKVLIISQLFFCFIWLIFNQNDFQTAFELFYINLYSMNIQTDIFYSSLSIFAKCGIYGELTSEEQAFENTKMEGIADELREHSKLFISYLNNQIYKDELEKIFYILNKPESFITLLPNKQVKEHISSFYEEFNLYRYKMYQIANYGSFDNCSLKDLETSETTNEQMREVHYITHNVVSTLSVNFNELADVGNGIINHHITRSKSSSLYFIIVAIIVEIGLMILIQYIMNNHKVNIQIILNQIYAPNKNDNLFEEDLFNYKELLFSFTKESYIHFRSMHRKILTDEKDDNAFNNQGGNDSFSDDTASNNGDLNDNLNKGNSNIINEITSAEIIFKFSDKATIPKHHSITMMVMYLAGIVFIILEAIHLYIILNFYNDFRKSNSIALNFINLMPKMIELLLYLRVSIMMNDSNYITVKVEDYNSNYNGKDSTSVYNFYKDSYDDASAIVMKYQPSKFAYLYYQISQIRTNIRIFLAEHNNILPNLKELSKNIKMEGEHFCIYSSLFKHYLDFKPSKDSTLGANELYDFSNLVKECRTFGNGFNVNGFNTVIDAVLFNLERAYNDFTGQSPSERNVEEHLRNEEVLLVERNIKGQLKYVYSSYVELTMKDIRHLVVRTKNIGIIFSFALLLSIVSYTMIVFFLMKIATKNLSVLVYIKSFMEQALNSKQ